MNHTTKMKSYESSRCTYPLVANPTAAYCDWSMCTFTLKYIPPPSRSLAHNNLNLRPSSSRQLGIRSVRLNSGTKLGLRKGRDTRVNAKWVKLKNLGNIFSNSNSKPRPKENASVLETVFPSQASMSLHLFLPLFWGVTITSPHSAAVSSSCSAMSVGGPSLLRWDPRIGADPRRTHAPTTVAAPAPTSSTSGSL